jgi:hypothetical protein
LDAIRYTTHAEDSCNALSQKPEYESDIYLVQLVKLQQIAENITQALPYDAPQSFWTSKPPIGLLVKAFEMELQSFKESLPQALLQDRKLTLPKPLYHLSYLPEPSKLTPIAAPMLQHLQSCEIHLFEISLCDYSSRHQAPDNLHFLLSSRIQTLHSTLLAASSYLQTFLSVPISSYSSFPFIVWVQTLHAMQVLSKLSLLTDVPGWDLTHVRGIMDFGTLLDQISQRFDEAREDEERVRREQGAVVWSRYVMYTQKIGRVKAWYEGKLAAMATLRGQEGGVRVQARDGDGEEDGGGNGNGNGAADMGVQGGGGLRDDFLTGSVLDDLDDAYWPDFLGDWGSLAGLSTVSSLYYS